ncbi:MAG TPA: choice-of-anchor tandem repeat GloVer-containing protein [Rhizomicrobium sp.]|jgi:uncharacterized repeat protein (TIGR03803 family)|nr:choice-of-anchor tandem repeat GloVer-containing protein [Rhizomicrobium sp.]
MRKSVGLPVCSCSAFMLAGAVMLAQAASPPAQSGKGTKFHVVYVFQGGTDASSPIGGLISRGKIRYGTTYYGGANNLGTVYALAPGGKETVVYSFAGGSDGEGPQAPLLADATGNLYGTTYYGGAGCGSVFKVTPRGKETVLYGFSCAGRTGASPTSGLIMDASGNLYSTTYGGGTTDQGTVFKIASDGTESVVYSFAGGSDGAYPAAPVIADAEGNMYGTTYGGGSAGLGTVFKISSDGTESVLYSFQGGSDGATPFTGLIMDAKGNLYGTTYTGGSSNCNGSGCGTVFELATDGTETVRYSFQGGSDGMYLDGPLTADKKGNLYGSTLYGGNIADCSKNGCGMVFRLATDGTRTVLHEFTGSDGAQPGGTLLTDKTGEIYATTYNGGNTGCGGTGCGVIFKMKE